MSEKKLATLKAFKLPYGTAWFSGASFDFINVDAPQYRHFSIELVERESAGTAVKITNLVRNESMYVSSFGYEMGVEYVGKPERKPKKEAK